MFFFFFLEKKNGITKEMEAEFGDFNDKLLYKTKCKEKVINEKKPVVKAKKLDNSMPIKNGDNFQTCYDIISNFEDMIVRKKHCADAGNSSYLDSTVNKIHKIYKSFDIASKDSKVEHSKCLKTYSVRKAYMKTKKIKSNDVEKLNSYPETNSINIANTCLNENNMSSDINLQNHTLSASYEFLNDVFYHDDDDDHSKNEKVFKQLNSDIDNNQIEMYSEPSGILSDEFFENSPQRKNLNVNSTVQIFEDMNSFGSENMTVLDKNVEVSASRKSLEEMPVINKTVELTARRKSFENMPVLERNIKLSAARKSVEKVPVFEKNLIGKESLTIKQKKFKRTVVCYFTYFYLLGGRYLPCFVLSWEKLVFRMIFKSFW